MADIELVIKIPEITYNAILERKQLAICNDNDIYKWIKNGKPLPKGHGDLIDINEITAFRELECNGHNVKSLDEFTTIIKADKEDKE